ncbi:MAG TPA: hypothetical protein PKN22_05105 [Taishania sp.]|nr:hypothetical protein [Taishania sp.]
MKNNKLKFALIFVICLLIVNIPLWFFPIQLFPGVIEFQNGLQAVTIEAPLSLSHFIGKGFNEGDLENVNDFYLKPTGYALAFIICIGLPFIIALRWSNQQKK